MKKKLFSILLSLAMVVTMIPMMTGVAFAGNIETIGDVLSTVENFPTSDNFRNPPDNAWVRTTGDSCSCFKRDNEKFVFGTNGNGNTIELASSVVKIGDNYVFQHGSYFAITFNMDNGVLKSIQITSRDEAYNDVAGTYEPPAPAGNTVTFRQPENGSIALTADGKQIKTGDKVTKDIVVTITATPDNGYELDTLTVTDADGKQVTVTNNQFTMPDKAVTVSATFKVKSNPTPPTGDSSDIFFYGFTTLLALLGAGFVYGLRRKEEK